MSILKKLLPPEEKVFYECFDKASVNCNNASELLNRIIYEGLSEEFLVEARNIKHLSNDIAKEALRNLNTTFITPIDREDIQAVAFMLNKITKKIARVCFNLKIYSIDTANEHIRKQIEMVLIATKALIEVVDHLKTVSKIAPIAELNARIKEIESRGDEILHMAMEELFSGKYETLDVIKLKAVYRGIEEVLDGCFGVSDMIVNISLKHS